MVPYSQCSGFSLGHDLTNNSCSWPFLYSYKTQAPNYTTFLDTAEKQNFWLTKLLSSFRPFLLSTLALLSINVLCSMGINQTTFFKIKYPPPQNLFLSYTSTFIYIACPMSLQFNCKLVAGKSISLTSYYFVSHCVLTQHRCSKIFKWIPLSAPLVILLPIDFPIYPTPWAPLGRNDD